MLAKHPSYKMDEKIMPDDSIDVGVDCSRDEYLIWKWSAVPGIQRTTAERMARGEAGWTGIDISYEEADDHDLFFYWKSRPDRIRHVGGRYLGKVMHASETRGVVLDPLVGKMRNDIIKVRRILK
jgi:hypothetical protein